MIEKNVVSAKVIAHSISEYTGKEILTWEVSYPRIIHSELMTHRMFSRNAASSRAIPFDKMKEQLQGIPSEFGKNQSGMQSAGEHDALIRVENFDFLGIAIAEDSGEQHETYYKQLYDCTPEEAWDGAKLDAIKWSKAFYEAGYHKQVFNRLTEPFQMMKTIITSTETSNFFWLREHGDADPTIHDLATAMAESADLSTPKVLKYGEWHLPYVNVLQDCDDPHNSAETVLVEMEEGKYEPIHISAAIKMSVARCAAVSFRNVDYPLEKCLEVFERLVGADRKHSSSLEHQATPIRPAGWYEGTCEFTKGHSHMVNHSFNPFTWDNGISHVGRNGKLWSGNFCDWLQFRKTMKGENYADGT